MVYAISSTHKNWIYVGFIQNLSERLRRHNGGYDKTTKPYAPFELIYTEECADRIHAREREKYWKSGVGKQQLYLLKINSSRLSPDK